jgi:hypothetical protein
MVDPCGRPTNVPATCKEPVLSMIVNEVGTDGVKSGPSETLRVAPVKLIAPATCVWL